MKIVPHARQDPPPAHGEIEFRPATPAQAPGRVCKTKACASLKAVLESQELLAAEVAQKTAALEKARADAAALHQELENLTLEHAEASDTLRWAEAELARNVSAQQTIKAVSLEHFKMVGWSDHSAEWTRREFAIAMLNSQIPQLRKTVADFAEAIAAFRKKHDFPA